MKLVLPNPTPITATRQLKAICKPPGKPSLQSKDASEQQELPIKKLLLGQPLEKVVNRDAMANPACLMWCVEFAQQHIAVHGAPV